MHNGRIKRWAKGYPQALLSEKARYHNTYEPTKKEYKKSKAALNDKDATHSLLRDLFGANNIALVVQYLTDQTADNNTRKSDAKFRKEIHRAILQQVIIERYEEKQSSVECREDTELALAHECGFKEFAEDHNFTYKFDKNVLKLEKVNGQSRIDLKQKIEQYLKEDGRHSESMSLDVHKLQNAMQSQKMEDIYRDARNRQVLLTLTKTGNQCGIRFIGHTHHVNKIKGTLSSIIPTDKIYTKPVFDRAVSSAAKDYASKHSVDVSVESAPKYYSLDTQRNQPILYGHIKRDRYDVFIAKSTVTAFRCNGLITEKISGRGAVTAIQNFKPKESVDIDVASSAERDTKIISSLNKMADAKILAVALLSSGIADGDDNMDMDGLLKAIDKYYANRTTTVPNQIYVIVDDNKTINDIFDILEDDCTKINTVENDILEGGEILVYRELSSTTTTLEEVITGIDTILESKNKIPMSIFPAEWEPHGPEIKQKAIDVNRNSHEFAKVESLLHKSAPGRTIQKLTRIQNPKVYHQVYKEWIKKNAHEKVEVWHGEGTPLTIIKNGLDDGKVAMDAFTAVNFKDKSEHIFLCEYRHKAGKRPEAGGELKLPKTELYPLYTVELHE